MSKLEYRDIKQPNYRHIGNYTPRKDDSRNKEINFDEGE